MIPELPELTQLPAVKAAGTAALDKALGYQFRMPPMPGMANGRPKRIGGSRTK